MTVEAATYIDDLVPANCGPDSLIEELGEHDALIKTVLQTTFPSISGAVTATHTEMNYSDITTLGTAQASKVLTADASANVNAGALTWTNLGAVTTADINGGTLDGVTIGGASAAAATVTNLTVTGTAVFSGTVTGVDQQVVLNAVIADISTAETVWVVCPVAGTIVGVYTVIAGTIATADSTVTVTTAADAAIASIVVTASGSAAGDVDADVVLTNDTVTAGQALKVSTNGNSTNSVKCWVSILINT